MQNNTIHQLSFSVKQSVIQEPIKATDNGWRFSDATDSFSDQIVF